MTTPTRLRQHVRYLNASDGTRLAWAESGDGRSSSKRPTGSHVSKKIVDK